MAKEKPRESPSGYHFFNLFQDCPRKFYIKYLLGFISFHTSPPLIEGGAFHAGKAVYYKTQSSERAMNKVEKEIASREHDYEEPRAFERGMLRVPTLLLHWILDWGEFDLETYNFLEVEVQHRVALPNGYYLTVRGDAAAQRKDNEKTYLMETKTTGFSKLISEQGVLFGDQATAYLWAYSKVHPTWEIEGIIPDISYWHKGSSDPTKISNHRGQVVRRTEEGLKEFAWGTMNIISDISQRVRAVQEGMNPVAVFPRNTQWCTSYARPCEYVHICRTQLDPNYVPAGFVKDNWAEEHKVLNFPKVTGGKNDRLRKAKKSTVQVQTTVDIGAFNRAVRRYVRTRQARAGSLDGSSRVHRMVDHNSNVRDGLARLLRSGSFRWLPQVRRKHYIALLQDGHSREEGSHIRPARSRKGRGR